jgi:adenylate cyclase
MLRPVKSVVAAGSPPLDPAAVSEALAGVLKEALTSSRQKQLLRYVVEEALAGRAANLKAYGIATAVLARGARFDPGTDPVVRTEMSALRRRLQHYYLTRGREAPIRIVIHKGSYVPRFEFAPPQVGPATSRFLTLMRYMEWSH